MDTKPGQVRNRAAEIVTEWLGLQAQMIAEAQSEGDIEPAEDPEQLAFELNALLLLGNAQYVISGGRTGPEQARLGIERRLALARTQPAPA